MIKHIVLSLTVPFPLLFRSGAYPKEEVFQKRIIRIGGIGLDSPEAAEELRKILERELYA
jgi:hypothetical protein